MSTSSSTTQTTGANPAVSLVLRTSRLELVAATLSLIETELAGAAQLARSLDAESGAWPPPLNDEKSLRWTAEKLRAHPEHAGFYIWYVVLTENHARRLVGLVAFKGPPDANGSVETGYSVVEEFQRRGIGTEATRALIEWAFQHPQIQEVTAETYPELHASLRVMQRCGMNSYGEGSEPRTVRYGIRKKQFQIQL
jgi:[ribosomal protein S5]-alanine N-acetyltransferase